MGIHGLVVDAYHRIEAAVVPQANAIHADIDQRNIDAADACALDNQLSGGGVPIDLIVAQGSVVDRAVAMDFTFEWWGNDSGAGPYRPNGSAEIGAGKRSGEADADGVCDRRIYIFWDQYRPLEWGGKAFAVHLVIKLPMVLEVVGM